MNAYCSKCNTTNCLDCFYPNYYANGVGCSSYCDPGYVNGRVCSSKFHFSITKEDLIFFKLAQMSVMLQTVELVAAAELARVVGQLQVGIYGLVIRRVLKNAQIHIMEEVMGFALVRDCYY